MSKLMIKTFTELTNKTHLLEGRVNEFTSQKSITVKDIKTHISNGFQSNTGIWHPELVVIVTYFIDSQEEGVQ